MSMPFDTNPEKLGRIEVVEDDTHFIVRIHPENRDRAKKILGRQWDEDRKAWVYPKDQLTHEALVEEFQKDADSFNIQRPKIKRPPGIKPPAKERGDEFDDHIPEEIRSLGDFGEGQTKIHGELEQILGMLESLKDVAANQSRTLEELRGTQEQANRVLSKFELTTQQPSKPKAVEVLPEHLDLTKQKEVELLEKALIAIICLTTSDSKSFLDWVSNHHPLSRPTDFVNETHEFIKKQLGKIVEDENRRTDFISLIQRAKDLLYSDDSDPTIKTIEILYTLNRIRNRFAHPPRGFNQSERWSRSILYLMNLA